MSDIITTLHPENDGNINLYPNIKKENIPDKAVDLTKISDGIKSLLDSINQLKPSGVDTSAHILVFTTNKGIYIGSDTGNWYYWNGTSYVSGGVYQATAIAPNSVNKTMVDSSILASEGILTSILAIQYGSANNLPINRIFYIPSTRTSSEITNLPLYGFNAMIVTFSFDGESTNNGMMQLISYTNGDTYTRIVTNIDGIGVVWSEWEKLGGVKTDLFASFRSFGVIGDSLSVGCVTAGGDYGYTARNLYFSWGQYIARKLGTNCVNIGKSGVTVKGWLTDVDCYPYFNSTAKQCQCYVIALGVNDINVSTTVGSSSDIHVDDYTLNADTFYGNYGKIISLIKEKYEKAKIFICTIPYPYGEGSNAYPYNTAIRTIATLFDDVYLVDARLTNNNLLFKNPKMVASYINGHYTPIGYKIMSDNYLKIINDTMHNNYNNMLNIVDIPDGFDE